MSTNGDRRPSPDQTLMPQPRARVGKPLVGRLGAGSAADLSALEYWPVVALDRSSSCLLLDQIQVLAVIDVAIIRCQRFAGVEARISMRSYDSDS
jgi:hypothetical protein